MDYTQEVVLDNKWNIHGDGDRHTKKRIQKITSLFLWVSPIGFTHLLLSPKQQLFKSSMENRYCGALIRIEKKLWFKSIWAKPKCGFIRIVDLNQSLHLIRITWGCDLNHDYFMILIKWPRGNFQFSHNLWFE